MACLLFERDEAIIQILRGEPEVSVHEAGIILKCDGLQCLVNSGHLTISAIVNKITYVTMQSILAFDKAYLSVRGLLDEAGIQIPTLLRIARMAKIDLMSVGDHCRDGKRWFVPRDQLDEIRNAIPQFAGVYPPRKPWRKASSSQRSK